MNCSTENENSNVDLSIDVRNLPIVTMEAIPENSSLVDVELEITATHLVENEIVNVILETLSDQNNDLEITTTASTDLNSAKHLDENKIINVIPETFSDQNHVQFSNANEKKSDTNLPCSQEDQLLTSLSSNGNNSLVNSNVKKDKGKIKL